MNYDIGNRSYSGASVLQDRVAFVRSVYLWLMGGFAVAAVGALLAKPIAVALIPSLGRAFTWVMIGAQFGTLIWANAVSRRSPMNRVAYGVFTFVSGVIAGIVSLVVAAQSGPGIVLGAFGMTAGAFLVLTVTAFVSKSDFNFLRSFVIVGIAIMFFGSILNLFLKVQMFSLLISAVAVIACSAKILWDTATMLRTEDRGDAAGFALSLFVSLYNIFIALLNLLSGGRRD